VPLDEVAKTYGTPIDAIIGHQLMARYVVKIDLYERVLTLYDPATFSYKGDGAVLPLEVRSRTPVVRAAIRLPGRPPLEGEFLVDEPRPGALMFATPFIRRHDLLTAARTVTPRMLPGSATGVGGRFDVLDGRVESIKLGPYELKLPTAGFPEVRAGAFARTDIAGIIGGEVWRRFRLWLDYAHGHLILEPGAQFRDPFESDAAGLRILSVGPPYGEFVVAAVTENSPAAEAGIKPAAGTSLWEIRKILKRPGRKYLIKLRRGADEVSAAVETRALN